MCDKTYVPVGEGAKPLPGSIILAVRKEDKVAMKETKQRKDCRLSLRIDEKLHNELISEAELYNCKVSEIATARLNNDNSILDKKAVYKAVMKVASYMGKQESVYRNIDNSAIRKELMDICVLLNS